MIETLCCIVSIILPIQIQDLVRCLTGPETPEIRPLCCTWCDPDKGYSPFDLTGDGLIDLRDYAEYQNSFEGPSQ